MLRKPNGNKFNQVQSSKASIVSKAGQSRSRQSYNKNNRQIQIISSHLQKKLSQVKSTYKNIYTYQYKQTDINQNSKKKTKIEIIPAAKGYEKLYDRKESYLNSCYNKRMKNLVNITKQNKKIHHRINSQQSSYSARDLNASYQSRRSISASRSRYSNRLKQSSLTRSKKSSRISLKNKNIGTKVIEKKLQPLKINQIGQKQLPIFKRMFNQAFQAYDKCAYMKQTNIDKQFNKNLLSKGTNYIQQDYIEEQNSPPIKKIKSKNHLKSLQNTETCKKIIQRNSHQNSLQKLPPKQSSRKKNSVNAYKIPLAANNKIGIQGIGYR